MLGVAGRWGLVKSIVLTRLASDWLKLEQSAFSKAKVNEDNTFEKSKAERVWSLYNKEGGYNLSLEQKRLSGCADFSFPFSPQTPPQ